jgi:NfeD-like C-terminal, partner-binding
MEVLLFLLLIMATLVLIDVHYGTGIVIRPIQAGTRYLWRRHPQLAEKLGLGQEFCDTQRLNDPAGALVGRIGVVEQAIVAGRGRLAIDGTTWSVQGPDLPVGTLVKISQARGNILVVDVA